MDGISYRICLDKNLCPLKFQVYFRGSNKLVKLARDLTRPKCTRKVVEEGKSPYFISEKSRLVKLYYSLARNNAIQASLS